jgi:primosomal protein N' (replication factor Y) (superfamily II helicase)
MFARVVPFAGTFDTYGLIYLVPEELRDEIVLFQFVSVPLRNQEELALVVEILTEIPPIDLAKIKSIISLLSLNTYFSADMLLLLEWMSRYYIVLIHSVAQLFFPKNMREKILKDTYDKVLVFPKNYILDFPLSLTDIQKRALKEIESSPFPVTLLYGVTGSGKTQIYIELARSVLQEWKSVLILVPEIVLTSQVASVISSAFGLDVVMMSSDVSDANKSKYWKSIHAGETRLVVGTRSALYYPYQKLGLIIMDEEHDDSYNSDLSPRYKTRDVLEYIANLWDTKVLLASGTPSITTMYRAVKWEFGLVNLLERYEE